MNHKDLLDGIKATGVKHKDIAGAFGITAEGLYSIIKTTNKDPLLERPGRLDTLKSYLKNRNNVDALALLHNYLREHMPRTLMPDLELYEVCDTPWTTLDLLLVNDNDDWLQHVLQIISNDGRQSPHKRRIRFIFSLRKKNNDQLWQTLNDICSRVTALRFEPLCATFSLPEGLPPTLMLDGKLYQFGDNGLIPCPELLTTFWQPALPANPALLPLESLSTTQIDTFKCGKIQPKANDGRHHILICKFNCGAEATLELLALGNASDRIDWEMTVNCSHIRADQNLRIVDAAGHEWVSANGDYLPWQDIWPYGDADPTAYLKDLRFCLQE
ncbi:MAG: hypothetical protein OIF57_16995 [Marinobacterium sp.]|nr:hypothetical protein [Marinobacterium sp.]